ncbi:chaperone NapD [Dyella koreensis]|uniref:Chaperone NapD n=1 Tax=Dyella koreensis TaxID=311235 RepID=A0ABW8JZ72_9GAMM
MNPELHISSLVVQHRHDAIARLEALIDATASMEIAARGDCRCVVLCETDNQRVLMDCIDELHAVDGVLTVSLIYHHAESREEMDKPIGQDRLPQSGLPQGADP